MDWHSNSYATQTAELGLPKADGRELTSRHREHIDPDMQYIKHEGLDPVEKVLDSDSDHFKVVLYVNSSGHPVNEYPFNMTQENQPNLEF